MVSTTWQVKGHIFKTNGKNRWNQSHAQVPFALPFLDQGFVRIFYATRDSDSCSSVSFIDIDPDSPQKIIYQHDSFVLNKGTRGTFDDSGTMPSWFIKMPDRIRMYYTAWNKSKEASYRLSIGVADSFDQGKTFEKLYRGPILDRNINDPIWVGQPCVIKEEDQWKMWYLCCEKIETIDGHPEPFYNVKYASSKDGLNWTRDNVICIDFDAKNGVDAIGRPCVYFEDGTYKMFHSNRSAHEYRTNPLKSYQIAYSESKNGTDWQEMEFELEGLDNNWSNQMNEYTTTYYNGNQRFLIFNGNGFGASGFGYAVVKE